MQTFVSLFFFLLSLNTWGNCSFKKEIHGVVSLSGIATTTIKELGLLKDPKLHGISIFNPVTKKDFSGTIYPGGLFLSQSSLDKFKHSVIFYDESRELSRLFKMNSNIIYREVRTRNKTPQEAVNSMVLTLSEFIQNCELELKTLNSKVSLLEKQILNSIPQNLEVIFYLGEFFNARPPSMVMVHDGIVKWLIQENKIKSYPSNLAYINWSAKVINALPKSFLHVGLKDSGANLNIGIKKSSDKMTLIYPGILVPGVTQLEGFLYLLKNL